MPRPRPPPAPPSAEILAVLQREAPVITRTLARRLRLTFEATRLLLRRLTAAGLVCELPPAKPTRKRRGRPAARYALTAAGLEALPKAYADMTLGVVDAVATALGPDALRTVLGALTDARVTALARAWTASPSRSASARCAPSTAPTTPSSRSSATATAGDSPSATAPSCAWRSPVPPSAAPP